jgi:hypothetical protein
MWTAIFAVLKPLLGPLLGVLERWGLVGGAYVKGRSDARTKADLERAEADNEARARLVELQRRQLAAQHDRPGSRDELVERLRRGDQV